MSWPDGPYDAGLFLCIAGGLNAATLFTPIANRMSSRGKWENDNNMSGVSACHTSAYHTSHGDFVPGSLSDHLTSTIAACLE
jgi:hypothetical protein